MWTEGVRILCLMGMDSGLSCAFRTKCSAHRSVMFWHYLTSHHAKEHGRLRTVRAKSNCLLSRWGADTFLARCIGPEAGNEGVSRRIHRSCAPSSTGTAKQRKTRADQGPSTYTTRIPASEAWRTPREALTPMHQTTSTVLVLIYVVVSSVGVGTETYYFAVEASVRDSGSRLIFVVLAFVFGAITSFVVWVGVIGLVGGGGVVVAAIVVGGSTGDLIVKALEVGLVVLILHGPRSWTFTRISKGMHAMLVPDCSSHSPPCLRRRSNRRHPVWRTAPRLLAPSRLPSGPVK